MYLNVHSTYSLRYGTITIDELIVIAQELDVESLTLTDINTTMGIPEFVKACEKAGIKPIVGCEFRNNDELLYVAIARNKEGLKEINDILTSHNLQKKPFSPEAPSLQHTYIIYPLWRLSQKLRENEYIGIHQEEVNKLISLKVNNKMVALHPVTFKDTDGWNLHKALRAIDHNTLISKIEPWQMALSSEVFISKEQIHKIYASYPVIIENTKQIINDCTTAIDIHSIKNKKNFTLSAAEDRQLLEKTTLEGLLWRYGKNNQTAMDRTRHELEIIFKLGFTAYFLIAWDVVRYSMSQGIYHVGRGSGANSIVAYCLQITDVDPIKLNLYFERFLNPMRTSPPDFDIDYSWIEREKIQKYLFERYGEEHVALLGATTTFRGRSTIRELGKVFGLPKAEIDRLIDEPTHPLNKNNITAQVLRYASQLTDFPNARSIHAGGILISEEPITYYTALDLPPKGLPTTQWDMYTAEDIGFEKLDILSQRGIGHIQEAVELIKKNQNIDVDIHRVDEFFQDEKVKKRLRDGEATGCFYIESPGMRGLLKKLECDNYMSLVAASSIIRPGVASSGMMREYIFRYHNQEQVQYLHPVMKEQLAETFGVMVYQEDVIKVAHHFAGLDLAEADVLRRAMSGKFRSAIEFQKIESKYFENCRNKGYTDELAKEVWRQIASFAGYSFSKAHSASYAVESFQSLYLKSHYPLEFIVAVINNFGGFYRSWVYFNEARRLGANIELPCVNLSNSKTCLHGKSVYIGFVHVQNLEQRTIDLILQAREQGVFLSLADFVSRTAITKEQAIVLIRSGALRFTKKNKAELLWEVHMLVNKPVPKAKNLQLFEIQHKKFSLPKLEYPLIRDAYDEIELLGFSVSMSAFDMLETRFRGEILAKNMSSNVGKTVRMIGQLVTIKYTQTKQNEVMNFGTFIDVDGEFFDTVHFPSCLKNHPFRGDGVYLVLGKITSEFGFPSMDVEKMAKMPYTALEK